MYSNLLKVRHYWPRFFKRNLKNSTLASSTRHKFDGSWRKRNTGKSFARQHKNFYCMGRRLNWNSIKFKHYSLLRSTRKLHLLANHSWNPRALLPNSLEWFWFLWWRSTRTLNFWKPSTWWLHCTMLHTKKYTKLPIVMVIKLSFNLIPTWVKTSQSANTLSFAFLSIIISSIGLFNTKASLNC